MHPIFLDVGGFQIHTYGALSALGFVVVVVLTLRRTRRLGIPTDHVVDAIFWAAVGGLIGSRGLWILQNPDQVSGPMDLINLRSGGLVFYGALLLGIPSSLAAMVYRKMPILTMVDVFAAALPLGHALSRIGCLGAGCCYGEPTSLPWGVTYVNPTSDAPTGIPLHPTQVYEAIGLLGVFGLANLAWARRRFGGQVLLVWLGGYSVVRIAVEALRGDERGWFLGTELSTSQGISAVALVGVAVAWLVLRRWPVAAVATDPPGPTTAGAPPPNPDV